MTGTPTLRARHDGWTPDRQRGFVAALAEGGNVSKAAARVGMSRRSAYRLRGHTGAADFCAAWDAACADYRWRKVDLPMAHRAGHASSLQRVNFVNFQTPATGGAESPQQRYDATFRTF